MWHFPVTFPTLAVCAHSCKCAVHRTHPVVLQHFFVATDAVLFHHPLAGLFDKDHLGLGAQGKNGGMPHAVLGLEKILVYRIVVGNMAVIAVGYFTMRAVTPCSVLWRHNVTIHAGFRFVGKVG